ncbi:MAG: hypothetical protein KDD70_03385, partial [Bdellovibrionales bacterium]|nr:hypothetical protein [Bdellovibrionales bacterium]
TNCISITDGQIIIKTDLFNSGIRPAVNVGISVSRVGGAAQIKAMKKVAGTLRLDLAQYREMQAFAQFGSDLDAATQAQLARGERLVEILKQDQYQPMNVFEQVLSILAVNMGHTDDLDVSQIRTFEKALHQHLKANHKDVLDQLREKKALDDEITGKLDVIFGDFAAEFLAGVTSVSSGSGSHSNGAGKLEGNKGAHSGAAA